MSIPSADSPTYTISCVRKDLDELIQTMSTWPTWKIDSIQNENRNNVLSNQILHQILVTNSRH